MIQAVAIPCRRFIDAGPFWHGALYLALGALLFWPHGFEVVSDARRYLDLAHAFRGEAPWADVEAPYCYRVLPSFLVSLAPADPRFVFPIANLVLVALCAALLESLCRGSGFSRAEGVAGALLFLVSFPVVWYAPYALTDPWGMAFRIAATWLAVAGRERRAALAVLVGMLAREDTATVAIGMAIWHGLQKRSRRLVAWLAVVGLCILIVIAIRYQFAEIIGRMVEPKVRFARLVENLTRARGLLSLPLGLGLVGVLAAIPLFRPRRCKDPALEARLRLHGALLIGAAAAPLYALFGARFDARFLWQLYPALIPFALLGLRVLKPRGGRLRPAG